jgi:hypothetical protein
VVSFLQVFLPKRYTHFSLMRATYAVFMVLRDLAVLIILANGSLKPTLK